MPTAHRVWSSDRLVFALNWVVGVVYHAFKRVYQLAVTAIIVVGLVMVLVCVTGRIVVVFISF